jgi:7-cyano-7-deazaguanine reductase
VNGETRPALLGRPVDPEEYGRLDTFPSDPAQTFVELAGDELTALCPAIDGLQPDFYRWSIHYRPNVRCVETKSLKLYLLTFRDERVFAEHLAARIARDLAAVLDTVVTVRLVQNRRGGIETTVEAVAGQQDAGPPGGPPQLNPAR